ncbi:hypothetical protein LXA43DRAFT_1010837 [Ganoderma leucocontextum]|nr:hypothetical protein LXA43DRAFT_1010837 [Ganoderma leucocontextum]
MCFSFTQIVGDCSCTRLATVGIIAMCLSGIPPAIFTALRAYALTRRHWLSTLVFLLLSVLIVTNLMIVGFHVSGMYSPITGCLETIHILPSVTQVFVIASRVSTILADTILMAITWKLLPKGTWFVDYNARRETAKMKGLASIMLCNGITYFIVLSILNILHVIFTELSIASDGISSDISVFTFPLSSVLVSHFLLDLQEAHHRTVVGLATDDPLHTSRSLSSHSIVFANALGSLGAMIGPADYGREEDLDDEDADVHVAATECIPPTEGEPTHESRIEDEFAITEVPRGGDGEVAEVGV